MSRMNSIQILAQMDALRADMEKAHEDKADETAHKISGRIAQLNDDLKLTIEDEAAARAGASPLAGEGAGHHDKTLAEAVLGVRGEFKGLDQGVKYHADASVVSIPGITEFDQNLPQTKTDAFQQFYQTLPTSGSNGAQIDYKRGAAPTGGPDTLAKVTGGVSPTIAQMLVNYTDATASQETIAGYVPISERALKDYDQLQSAINIDLVTAIKNSIDAKVVAGNNSSGIVGVTNIAGIGVYTKGTLDKTIFDIIRRMMTPVMKVGGRPAYCAMSTDMKEEYDLYKTDNGLYQAAFGDSPWGMQVLQDINIPGIIVYDANGAELVNVYSSGINVQAGYWGEQFLKMELSLRGETTKALKVKRPDYFETYKPAAS